MSKGVFFIIAAAVLWGTTGTAQFFAPEGASPMTVGAFRLLVGGTGLLLLAVFSGSFKGGAPWNRLHVLLGGLAVAAYQVTFFTGVKLTGVAVGTIVAIGSAPVSAGILGYFILHEKIRMRWYISSALAILGCALLALSGGGDIQISLPGIICAFGAGFSYALYALLTKMLIKDHNGTAAVGLIFFLGAVLLSPILFVSETGWIMSWQGAAVAVHLGLITTTVSYVLFAKGLRTVSVSATATLSLVEPLTATILGIFLVGERINFMVGMGITCLFLGIAILIMKGRG
ncbi:DMT family transporter [Seleniivibrio woodruffii]|uniref:DME family drug/metabolite transporter n=1 Tax=Seleniivibrio woodruffii TaxID=1078050 RepID=A0A4R1KA45_9BACT|nr:DMT family transporter [Seleniivibrio woodruffii]TCK60910.1 DME family drug/metabolite transporter [Seleniivibrio woodruffii]TVZ36540.1 DME family drug/metabolite transporter [Seleniivibrio woodruffii]